MNRKLKTRANRPILLALMLMPFMMSKQVQAADNLNFIGNLVAVPCTLRPGDDAVTLDMSEISTHYLYANSRTIGKQFNIHLEGCDTSISDSVTTTFSGTPSPALPGLLALDGSSVAKGIALGIETSANLPLPLDTPSEEHTLIDGNNIIAFKAYVRGEPQAIVDKSIRAGVFTAVSTFKLDYP